MNPLRVLMLVAGEADGRQLRHHLRQDGLAMRARRINTIEAARTELAKPGWDVVLCRPGAAGLSAAQLAAFCREAGRGQPAILVLDASERAQAGELIRAGFADVVPQDNLARLGPAIEREVRSTAERRASRRVENDLQHSDARFRKLFEGASEGLIIHRLLKPLAANAAAARLFGFDAVEELLALDSLEPLLAPEEHQRVRDSSRARLPSGEAPVEYEIRGFKRDGSEIWLNNRAFVIDWPEGPAVCATLFDVTARKAATEALWDQHIRFQGVLDNVLDGIVTADESGVIESFNRAAERLFGYAAAEMLGRKVDVLMPDDIASTHDGFIRRYLDTGENRLMGIGPRELTARRKDGTMFPINLVLSEMSLEGRRVFIATISDISEHKEIEARLAQAEKMEAIGNLTGGIAHDFNNILGVVIGNLELLARMLKDSDNEGKATRRVEAATRAAFRGAELTSRLLSFSRRQILEAKSVDINELIAGMDDMLKRTLQEDNEIVTVLSEGLWSTRTDPLQFENALLNLAVNARDAMPRGGKLTIETANVRIDDAYVRSHPYAQPGDYVMLAVSDTGVGIPEDVLPHVFEPFFTTKDVNKGTGLGLSMIYGFAKQSGGHVGIYSEVGVGTTVRLYLPREMEPLSTRATDAGAEEVPRGRETVLIVEDDPGMRDTVVELLGDLGYTVLSAETGSQALALLDTAADIDLLLTDMVMPGGMNGRTLIHEARLRRPALKVVLSSGYAFTGATRSGLVEEDVAWIGKPYNLEKLAAKVREVLDD